MQEPSSIEFEEWYKLHKARLDMIVDGICNSANRHVTMPKSNVYNFYFDLKSMRDDLLKHLYSTSVMSTMR